MMTFADAKQRFSNRVADYLRYRSGYPAAVLEALRKACGLLPGHSVADIGSGTGFLSELFLKNGNRVYGIEPNEAMREAGEEYLACYDEFVSVEGSAESTTLEDAAVDFVAVGQAFHWFEPGAARREFARILKPAGWVVIIWNELLTGSTPFLRDYQALLMKFSYDYSRVSESYPREEQMREFFGPCPFARHDLPSTQEFDFAGLSGRLRSSSYAPPEEHPSFPLMMVELERIFRTHERDNRVSMEYLTRIYLGQLKDSSQ